MELLEELKERIRKEKIYEKEMTQWIEGYNAGLERATVILDNETRGTGEVYPLHNDDFVKKSHKFLETEETSERR